MQERLKVYQLEEAAQKKDGNTCSKCGGKTKKKLVPPPELEDKEEQISLSGREYSLLVMPWPPMQALAVAATNSPDLEFVNPENYDHRYPKSGDREQALIWARAKELRVFLPDELLPWLGNKYFMSVVRHNFLLLWFVVDEYTSQFSRAINTRKCHAIANCKSNRGEIFSHIPNIDTNLEFWRGDSELFPPILFPNGNKRLKHHVGRNEACLKVRRVW